MKRTALWKDLATIAFLAAVYFAIGKLGLLFSLSRPSITPVWPPSGIAVAGLLVLGYRVWPGILLGALAVELTTPCGLGTAFGVAAMNTLESLAAAWLANRFAGGRNFLDRPANVVKFAVLVGVVSPLVSSPLGVSHLALDRFIFWGAGGDTWLIWWLGDTVSMVVLTPLLTAWAVSPRPKWDRWKTLEFGILLLLLLAMTEAVFGGWAPSAAREYLLSYLCLPFLFWAAFRFGQRETMTATFVLGAMVMWGTLHGYGLFGRVGSDEALLAYQGFMATTSVMAMLLAAVVGERRQAGDELRRAHDELELRVQQRTQALRAEVAERQRAEDSLKASEYRYAKAQQAANIGSWDLNLQTGQLHWSEQIERIFGFGPGQFGRTYEAFLGCVHPEDRPVVTESVDAALQGRRNYTIEHRIIWPDGTVRWVAEAGEVQRDATGAPTRMLGIVRDITVRKEAQEASRVNLAKYSMLFESFPLGITVTDQQGKIRETNQEAVRLLGVPREEHTRRQVDSTEWQIIRPDGTPMPPEEYASVRAIKEKRRVQNMEMGIVKGNNDITWISVTAEPLPLEGYGVVVTYHDITERKQAEDLLQRNEAALRGILDAANESIWLFSPDGRILLVNSTAVQRLGDLTGEVIGKHLSEFLPAQLARTRLGRLREVVQSGRPVGFEDERKGIKFHHSFYPVFDGQGRVNSIACFSRDVTEQKQAERALFVSQERLQLAQQAGRIGTFDRNLQTGETVWSEDMETLFGLPPGAFTGSFAKWVDSIHPEDRLRVQETIQRGIADHTSFQMEFRLFWPDGSVHWIEARGKVVCDEHGQPLRTIGVNMDITERKRMQQALENTNKELQTANRNLQAVTERLRVSNQTLEQRVAERTENLRQTNRILRMISECNQALVHVSNEQELIQKICRTIHETGGYKMVWVGFAENDRARTVRPIGAVGFEETYLYKAKITWGDTKFGRGPTGSAIRTGKICTANDFLSDPALSPWRKLALQRGFRSSIALPLLAEGQTFGALTIYSTEPAAFDQNQILQLSDLAADLSFGITTLRVQAERDQGRQDLEQKTAQLRTLTTELVQAEERERRRIAQILHDSVQQLLVGARYGVEALRGQNQPEALQKMIPHVDDLLGRCLEASRSLTLELSPPILYEAGLPPALKWLSRWFRQTHGLTVRVIAQDEAFADTEDIRVALFNAVRELLFNIVKHAKVKRAQVRVSRVGENRIRILVTDNGAGFDPARLQTRAGMAGGFGLLSLRERLMSLGGQLEVESAPGRGSRFTIVVPVGRSSAELHQ